MTARGRHEAYFVYRLRDHAGRLLYVGMTWNPRARMKEHNLLSWVWFQHVRTVELDGYLSEEQAAAAEAAAIRDEHPSQNVVGSKERMEREGFVLASVPMEPTVWATARRVAQARGESANELIRSTLARYVDEHEGLLADDSAGPFVPPVEMVMAMFPMTIDENGRVPDEQEGERL